MRIVAKELNCVYSEKTQFAVKALDNVNLVIEEGEFYGIIGQTGSGKSTFVQHLNGLIKVGKKKGSLTVGDYDLSKKKCKYKELRSKVGMVFQYPEYQLFAETVEADVGFGLKNFFPKMSEEERKSAVRYALETVGLNYEKYKGVSPFELSGGQKRRVAIAGVIVTKPEILVLDEPASGLDPKGKRDLFNLLHSLMDKFVKTVIIVSHDMDAVMENCSRVAVFDHGKVIMEGSPKDVFSDVDKMRSLGLDVPVTVSVTETLRQNGIKINSDFTEESFIEGVVRFAEGKKL